MKNIISVLALSCALAGPASGLESNRTKLATYGQWSYYKVLSVTTGKSRYEAVAQGYSPDRQSGLTLRCETIGSRYITPVIKFDRYMGNGFRIFHYTFNTNLNGISHVQTGLHYLTGLQFTNGGDLDRFLDMLPNSQSLTVGAITYGGQPVTIKADIRGADKALARITSDCKGNMI